MNILSYNETVGSYCSDFEISAFIIIVKQALDILQILVPIILLVMAMIQMAKMMMFPDDKKQLKSLYNKFIAAIIVFLLPFLLNITLIAINYGTGNSNIDINKCLSSVNNKRIFGGSYIETKSDKKKTKLFNDNKYELGSKPSTTEETASSNGKEKVLKKLPIPKFIRTASGNKLSIQITSTNLDVNGFEIQYSKDFLWLTGATRRVSKDKANRKYTFALNDAEQYYVRVRSYKIINGVKYYSRYNTKKCTKYGVRNLSYKAMTGTSYSTNLRRDSRLAGYSVHQGACVDNEGNVYMAFMKNYHSNPDGHISRGSHVKIAKLNSNFKIVKVSKDMALGHINGMAYDTKRNRIIATRAATNDLYVSVIDPNTFQYNYKKVTGTHSVKAFNDVSYDEQADTFILHSRHPGGRIVITNPNFQTIKQYHNKTSLNQGSTTFSKNISDKYGHQYYIESHSSAQSTSNYIRIYDVKNNKLMQTLRLPYKCEIENVWVYNNHLYCSVHKHIRKSNGKLTGGTIIFKL